MQFSVHVDVAARRRQVWDVLTDWERQPQWMLDAVAVEVLTPQRTGTGVTIRCPTRLLGVTVDDVMRVTEWAPPYRLAVTHLGSVITGHGAFDLADLDGARTRVTWWEAVDPPLGGLGELGARTLVRPVLRVVFTRSLRRFAALVEDAAVRDA